MPFNVFARQPAWQVLTIAGPDARDFLNRVTSADFKRLRPSEATPGTLLTANGKLTLYFKALHPDEGRYLLLVPPIERGAPSSGSTPSPARIAFEAFEKIHFREQLTLTPQADDWVYLRALVSDEAAVDALRPLTPEPAHVRADASTGAIVFNENRWTLAPIRLDLGLLAPVAAVDRIEALLTAAGLERAPSLEGYRLRAADPACPFELNTGTLAPEARLDDAVHEGKGCYPGQEVVERIRSMGQAPRLLASLRGEGHAPEFAAGATLAIAADGQTIGELTSAADDPIDGGWAGLGYVKRVLAPKADSACSVGPRAVSLRIK